MKRKDLLAAGALKQTYAGGVGEGDIFRNVSTEPRMEFTPDTTVVPVAKKRFRPLGNGLLVRQTVEEVKSAIILENTTEKERPCEGTVLEIGKDLTTIAVGDTVVFGKYAGQSFKLNGEELLILNEDEVKGVLYSEDETEEKVFELGGCTNLVSGIGRA